MQVMLYRAALLRSNVFRTAINNNNNSKNYLIRHLHISNIKYAKSLGSFYNPAYKRTLSIIPGVLFVGGFFGIVVWYVESFYFWYKNPQFFAEEEDGNGKRIKRKITNFFKQMPPNNINLSSLNVEAKQENNVDINNNKDFPSHSDYILIGAGLASFAAARSIRINNPNAKILMIGDEEERPYIRPPLSKDLWFEIDENLSLDLKYKSWSGKSKSIYLEPAMFFDKIEDYDKLERGGIFLANNTKVTNLDMSNLTLTLNNGKTISFKKCLIATGGTPKKLDCIGEDTNLQTHITYFRTAKDYLDLITRLHNFCEKVKTNDTKTKKTVAILGGGFLGSELTSSINHKFHEGINTMQIIGGDGILSRVLPQFLSQWVTSIVKDYGIQIIPQSKIKSVAYDKTKDNLSLELTNSQKIECDHVIVAIGIEPNLKFLKNSASFLKVDKTLRYTDNIWAAGDVMMVEDENKKTVYHQEHYDNATNSGRIAGYNMSSDALLDGVKKNPLSLDTQLSSFWTDIGPKIGLEGVGHVDSSLTTLSYFAKDIDSDDSNKKTMLNTTNAENEVNVDDVNYKKGVVFYMDNDQIVGILTVNLDGQQDVAKRIIKMNTKNPNVDELAKLFDIYDLPHDKAIENESLPPH